MARSRSTALKKRQSCSIKKKTSRVYNFPSSTYKMKDEMNSQIAFPHSIAASILFRPTKSRIKSQFPSFFFLPREMKKRKKKTFPPLFILLLTYILKLISPWYFQTYFHLKNVSNGGNIAFRFSTYA